MRSLLLRSLLLCFLLFILSVNSSFALSAYRMVPGEEDSILTSPIPGNQEYLENSIVKYIIENSDDYFAIVLVDNIDYSKTYLFTFTWPVADGYRIFAFYPSDLSTHPRGVYLSTDSMDRGLASLWNCTSSVALINVSFEPSENKIGQLVLLISSDQPEKKTNIKIEVSPYSEEQISGALEYPTCSSNHKGFIGSSFTVEASDTILDVNSFFEKVDSSDSATHTEDESSDHESNASTYSSNGTGIDWNQGEFEDIGNPKAALIWQEAEEDTDRILHNTGTEFDSRELNSLPGYSGAGYWYLSRAHDTLIYDRVYTPEDADYDFWIRDYSDVEQYGQRAINLYIDDVLIGTFTENILMNGFEWNYLATVYLTTGFHVVKIEKAENTSAAALIDAFLLTRDTDYIPEGKFVYHGPFILDDGRVDNDQVNQETSGGQETEGQGRNQVISSVVDVSNTECTEVNIDTDTLTDLNIKFSFQSEDAGKNADFYFVFNYDGSWLSFNTSGQIVAGIAPFIEDLAVPGEITLLDLKDIDFKSFKGHNLTLYSGYLLYESFPMPIKYGCIKFNFK